MLMLRVVCHGTNIRILVPGLPDAVTAGGTQPLNAHCDSRDIIAPCPSACILRTVAGSWIHDTRPIITLFMIFGLVTAKTNLQCIFHVRLNKINSIF